MLLLLLSSRGLGCVGAQRGRPCERRVTVRCPRALLCVAILAARRVCVRMVAPGGRAADLIAAQKWSQPGVSADVGYLAYACHATPNTCRAVVLLPN
jgi:hypothetical protein